MLDFDDLKYMIEGHEIDKRDDWERSRMQAYLTLVPDMKKGSGMTPQKLFPFPWEKVDIVKFEKEEIAEMSKLAEIVRNKKMIRKDGKS